MAQPRIPYGLWLRPISSEAICAIARGQRLPDWAEDYPAAADVGAARILHLAGAPIDGNARWGRHQVLESSGCVVGGAGFLGAPAGGEVEIAYGVVPSRRGRGYATEIVGCLLRMTRDGPSVRAVVARTSPGNIASRRVLERHGFHLDFAGADLGYRLDRSPSGSSSSEGSGRATSATAAPAPS